MLKATNGKHEEWIEELSRKSKAAGAAYTPLVAEVRHFYLCPRGLIGGIVIAVVAV